MRLGLIWAFKVSTCEEQYELSIRIDILSRFMYNLIQWRINGLICPKKRSKSEPVVLVLGDATRVNNGLSALFSTVIELSRNLCLLSVAQMRCVHLRLLSSSYHCYPIFPPIHLELSQACFIFLSIPLCFGLYCLEPPSLGGDWVSIYLSPWFSRRHMALSPCWVELITNIHSASLISSAHRRSKIKQMKQWSRFQLYLKRRDYYQDFAC